VLGHVRVDDGQREIAPVGLPLSGGDDAAQQPDVLLLEHQSSAGVSAAGTRGQGIAGADRVRGDEVGILRGEISPTLRLGNDVRVRHLGPPCIPIAMLVLAPASHIGLVPRGQIQQIVLVPQTDGFDVVIKSIKVVLNRYLGTYTGRSASCSRAKSASVYTLGLYCSWSKSSDTPLVYPGPNKSRELRPSETVVLSAGKLRLPKRKQWAAEITVLAEIRVPPHRKL